MKSDIDLFFKQILLNSYFKCILILVGVWKDFTELLKAGLHTDALVHNRRHKGQNYLFHYIIFKKWA